MALNSITLKMNTGAKLDTNTTTWTMRLRTTCSPQVPVVSPNSRLLHTMSPRSSRRISLSSSQQRERTLRSDQDMMLCMPLTTHQARLNSIWPSYLRSSLPPNYPLVLRLPSLFRTCQFLPPHLQHNPLAQRLPFQPSSPSNNLSRRNSQNSPFLQCQVDPSPSLCITRLPSLFSEEQARTHAG